MDKFKQYLQQHEADMNVDAPSEQVWDSIQHKTTSQPGKLILLMRRYAVAAVVLVMIGAGIIIITNAGKQGLSPQTGAETKNTIGKENPNGTKKISDTVDSPGLANTVPVADKQKKRFKAPVKMTKTEPANSRLAEKSIAAIGDGYTSLISYQVKKLRTTPVYAEQPGYFSRFGIQLKQMDADEEGVKKDIKTYGLNDKLLEQLINVYQQKLNLLKSLQQEINKMNSRVKENESPSDTLKPYFLHL